MENLDRGEHELPWVRSATAFLPQHVAVDQFRFARFSEGGDIWTRYMQLTQIEAAFRSLKSDLRLRPIHHQLEHRIDAHIFIAFLAYCLQVTLKNRLRQHASGLTPTAVLEKLASIQLIDVWIPTRDGRWLILPRYTQPDRDLQLLLHHLQLTLPAQPPPRIRAAPAPAAAAAQGSLW